MLLRIHEISVLYDEDQASALRAEIRERLGKAARYLKDFQVVRRAVDARAVGWRRRCAREARHAREPKGPSRSGEQSGTTSGVA